MNYWLIPTSALALGLFGLGVWLSRRTAKGLVSGPLVVVATAAAVPGVVFCTYYLGIFGEPIWLYEFRSWPLTELSAGGAGLLAGLLHGRHSSGPQFRRVAGRFFFPGVLMLGLLAPYAKPVVRPPHWSQFQDQD